MQPARQSISLFVLLFAPAVFGGNAFGGASITLQPVPLSGPAAYYYSYPPGTTIVGQEIILGSVPARVWLEVHITGWAPENLRAMQATISANDAEHDGGGYSGANAMCGDSPAVGAGDLRPAAQPCNTNADCTSLVFVACAPPPASLCLTWNGVNPAFMPAGKYCDPAFQSICAARYTGDSFLYPEEYQFLNSRFGFAFASGEFASDWHPSYIGTLVLDVPANARGTYTIDFKEDETFMSNDGPPGNNTIPVTLIPAKITVPCGRCCSGYASNQVSCSDGVGIGECASQIDQVFTAGETCPGSGGPPCAECATNNDCDDGIPCTANQCSPNHQCFFTPMDVACDDGLFCNGAESCNPTSGCAPGQSPCEFNLCDEEVDECRSGIPTVSNWGLVVLCLAVLIAAKLRWKPAPTA